MSDVEARQRALQALVDRVVSIGPANWVHTYAAFEYKRDAGAPTFTWLMLGVVDEGDRWGYGQFDRDPTVFDLTMTYHDSYGGGAWTTLELHVDRDGSFTATQGYGPVPPGDEFDAALLERVQDYPQTWTHGHGAAPRAQHQPAPPRQPRQSAPVALDRVHSHVELPDVIFQVVRAAAPTRSWVRLLLVQERGRELTGFGFSSMSQAVLWADGALDRVAKLDMDSLDYLDNVQDYFENSFEVPHWRRVEIRCDIDGRNVAVVTSDPNDGDAADEPTDFWNDPFWDHMEDNRAELLALGRDHYAVTRASRRRWAGLRRDRPTR